MSTLPHPGAPAPLHERFDLRALYDTSRLVSGTLDVEFLLGNLGIFCFDFVPLGFVDGLGRKKINKFWMEFFELFSGEARVFHKWFDIQNF